MQSVCRTQRPDEKERKSTSLELSEHGPTKLLGSLPECWFVEAGWQIELASRVLMDGIRRLRALLAAATRKPLKNGN